jgi:uncharacterized membrane protein HdeD (DUF308 family)
MRTRVRQRYFVFVSAVYVLLGLVLLVRAAMAGAALPAILGIIFVALGAVRLRDFAMWRHSGG